MLTRCCFTVPSNQKLQGSRGVTTVCLVYSKDERRNCIFLVPCRRRHLIVLPRKEPRSTCHCVRNDSCAPPECQQNVNVIALTLSHCCCSQIPSSPSSMYRSTPSRIASVAGTGNLKTKSESEPSPSARERMQKIQEDQKEQFGSSQMCRATFDSVKLASLRLISSFVLGARSRFVG